MVIYTSKDKPGNTGGKGFSSRMDTHSSSLSLPLKEAIEAQQKCMGKLGAWRSKTEDSESSSSRQIGGKELNSESLKLW